MANIIPFKVSARTARLIGRENVATSKGAIIELVKNGYDADSPFCVVLVDNKYVIIALKQYRLYHSNDTASLAWLQVSLFTWLAIPV